MTRDFVPVIDLGVGTARREHVQGGVGTAIAEACATSGFFVVTGHGVPRDTVAALYAAFREFFRGDPATQTAVAADLMDPLLRGYIPGERHQQFYVNRLGELTDDDDEIVALDARLRGPNRWPDVPGLRRAAVAYYAEIERLAGRLVDAFAQTLDVTPETLRGFFHQHMSPLVCNYYPPQALAPPEGSLRNAAHRDWCAFTILLQDSALGGLQILAGEEVWMDVPHVPDSFVVNLGRIMTLWTGGRWASTVHRVVNPGRGDAHHDRISIPFFAHPNPNLPLHQLAAKKVKGGETAGAFHIRMADSSRERKRLPVQSAAHVSSGVPAEFEVVRP
jgi:isopenicillin N synthase-like dioxygenase